MRNADIFHPDFVTTPYWWEAYTPAAGDLVEVPREARVAIVGGGYAGLAAALEFSKHGIAAVVLERGALGIGASTRNGGSVSGGVNVGKSFSGRATPVDPERARHRLSDASDAFALIERLIAEERIECFWQKRGRFVGAWTPAHFATQEKRVGASTTTRNRTHGAARAPREEIASDYYYGGMVVERSASLPSGALHGASSMPAGARDRDLRRASSAEDSQWRRLAGRNQPRHGHRRDV